MKTKASTFVVAALVTGSMLLPATARAQRHQPPPAARGTAQPIEGAAIRSTTSDPWEILPAMSANRCLAEAIGTASDPNTGAPARASVDPQTGRPLCPSAQQTASTNPPR